MKKLFHRLFALMLVCMLFASLAISVSAAEIYEDKYYVKESRAAYLPFTLIAQEVHDYVDTSGSGKSFTKDHVTDSVTTYGKLYNTGGGSYLAGVCYYDPTTNKPVYLPSLYASRSSGAIFNLSLGKSSLVSGRNYFAFADNAGSTTYYVHGTVAVDQY